MTINLDIDQLTKRKQELELELKELTEMISLARLAAKYTTYTPKVQTTPVNQPTLSNGQLNMLDNRKPKKVVTVGLRRSVILALHTGPANSVQDLSRYLGWDHKRTRITLQSMQVEGLVEWENGNIYLTDKGKHIALWFIAHPTHVVYKPLPAEETHGGVN